MIGALATLALLLFGWLLVWRRPRTPSRTQLRVAASSLWMLDHICVSLGGLLREWPELREIRLSVAHLTTLDTASVASLKGAISTAARARVRFRLDDYDPSIARQVMASGIDAEHLGAPRVKAASTGPLLH